jgi:hypothetical protein
MGSVSIQDRWGGFLMAAGTQAAFCTQSYVATPEKMEQPEIGRLCLQTGFSGKFMAFPMNWIMEI